MATTNIDKKKTTTAKKPTSDARSRKPVSGAGSKKNWMEFSEDDEEKSTRNDYICFGIGGFLCLFSLFAFLAIISYIFTGSDDYNYVQNPDLAPCGNFLGKLGARIAYFFVQKKFGFASLFIMVFMFLAGLRVMFLYERREEKKKKGKNGKKSASKDKALANAEEEETEPEKENPVYKIRLWKWFVNCGILTIWFSLFFASITKDFVGDDVNIKLGGDTGYGWVERLDEAVGGFFRYIILIVTAIAYLCYLSSETIRIIRRWVKKPVEIIHNKVSHENEGEEDDTEETTIIDPETGEVIISSKKKAGNADEGDENEDESEQTWEFRGGEDGPDHPTPVEPLTSVIDQNTATTIEFIMDGQNTPTVQEPSDTPEESRQMELFDEDNFGISTGVEEEKAVENVPIAVPMTEANNDMVVTIGLNNEEAEPDEEGALEPYDPKLDLENYRYPTLDLLKKYDIDNRAIDMEEQNQNKNKIITVLRNFGVEISSIKATVGPTITLYEITPAPGVRIGKIRNLEDDIALSLAALGIRIIAPIPGKGTIGIEVPNAKPQIVSMESVINSKKFQESDMELPMALGKTITNEIFMADLAKMPHLLVAGATGQGKSVGLNAILTSLLYKKHPAELKLVMVDPKKVEFSVYSPLVNHFLAQVEGTEDSDEPIITDVSKVIQTLKSLCLEMDTRYDLLKKAKARNLKEYNEKFKSRLLSPKNGHKFMPYIVVIIDEFGDLIMTAGKEIELPIARIAQLARAVGMHMIIATQRPTTNIITGTIKANFPARIAFKVSSMIDSRTILDRPGANQLVGKGDMLFSTGNEPIRVQCAFVDTPEVERINNFVACQQSYLSPFPLPFVELEGSDGSAPDVDMNQLDPMFEEVARLVVTTQQGSTSMIQRKFSIGYNRAGRLMDQLEVAGIVGPAHGSKPREVLCQSDIDLQNIQIELH